MNSVQRKPFKQTQKKHFHAEVLTRKFELFYIEPGIDFFDNLRLRVVHRGADDDEQDKCIFTHESRRSGTHVQGQASQQNGLHRLDLFKSRKLLQYFSKTNFNSSNVRTE